MGIDELVAHARWANELGAMGWGARHGGFTFCEDVKGSVIESHARDADWVARELGTVERRPVDWFGETVHVDGPLVVPVESLGREA